jgi:polysaccharide export outer membrane protein
MTKEPVSQRAWQSGLLCALALVLCLSPISQPFGLAVARGEEKEALSTGTSPQPEEYLIGPGDVLEILVWKEPDLSRIVRVRLDGKISLPLVDDIQASDFTLEEVKTRITKALSGYVDAPAVYVMLQENRSKKIYVIGKVMAPGEFVLEKETTILHAIAMAGGFAEWANKDEIVIIRKEPQGQLRIKFDYDRAVSGKDLKQNILLRPDDVIVVP